MGVAKLLPKIEEIQKEHLISTGFIKTKFGKLRIRFSGKPNEGKSNLVLFIHGSGVESSSDHYVDLIQELCIRSNFQHQFYLVAVDCPGYGKSTGKRQSIRSYPLEVIKAIYKQLGFSKCYAMYGHSQGGAAIFNACIMDSSICKILIQDRPVFAKSKLHELKSIKDKKILLVFDKDDPGHPISVGKLISKRLENVDFVSYSSKKNAFWWADTFPLMMLNFLNEKKSRKEKKKKIISKHRNKKKMLSVSPPPQQKKEKKQKINPNQVEKESKNIQKEKKKKDKEKKKVELPVLISDEDLKNSRCTLCLNLITFPIKTTCNHIFCEECFRKSIIYNPVCPLCRNDLSSMQKNKQSKKEKKKTQEFQEKWRIALIEKLGVKEEIIAKRKMEIKRELKKRDNEVIIEYGNSVEHIGNTTGKGKKKYRWKVFVRIPKKKKKKYPRINELIKEIEININPEYPKSAIKIKAPEAFEIERIGSSDSFEISIKIVWKSELFLRTKRIDEVYHTLSFSKQESTKQFIKELRTKKARSLFPYLYSQKKKITSIPQPPRH